LNTSSYLPQKCAGFLIEELDGELVLFHPARNIIIHANGTAALVWQLCDGLNTTEQIVNILSSAYPETRLQIEKDVPAIIQELQEKGVLEGG